MLPMSLKSRKSSVFLAIFLQNASMPVTPPPVACMRLRRAGVDVPMYLHLTPGQYRSNFIERIVASPTYPKWAIPNLQERVTAAGLSTKVDESDLLKRPKGVPRFSVPKERNKSDHA